MTRIAASLYRALCLLALAVAGAAAQDYRVPASVDFSRPIRTWDGFGINYVQTAQTRDYRADPQEYGGFSLLTEAQRQEILDLIFGPDGLKPGVLKMFLDPWHEGLTAADNDNQDPNVIDTRRFDHKTTTEWLRYFAREGLRKTRARGGDLEIVTTLYGPPAWMTRQKYMRGRDLNPAMKQELAEYMIAWVRYLRNEEKLPVKYLSLHNEGEDYRRWPADGNGAGAASHDYNLYWPPEQVVEFLKMMRPMLDRQGLQGVALTPGETTSWYRFHTWGYADAIAADPAAVRSLGLITSHGFTSFGASRWFADWRSIGTDWIREKKPELHSWVTSTSWSKMDARFIYEMFNNIYVAKVNSIIPWAAVQRPPKWVGGDPNPGTAFRVAENGSYEVMPGYYFYKQVSRAGQPGMTVVPTAAADSEVVLIGFGAGQRKHPEALIVVNIANEDKPIDIRLRGTKATRFSAFRSSPGESAKDMGVYSAPAGVLSYTAPAASVTTFTASR